MSVQVNSREEMIAGECTEETKGEHESTYVMMDCVGRSGAKSHGYRNPEDNDVNVARACLGLTSTPFASALDDLGCSAARLDNPSKGCKYRNAYTKLRAGLKKR